MTSDSMDVPFFRSVGPDVEAAIEVLRLKAREHGQSDRDLAWWLGRPTGYFDGPGVTSPMAELAAGNIEKVLDVADLSMYQEW